MVLYLIEIWMQTSLIVYRSLFPIDDYFFSNCKAGAIVPLTYFGVGRVPGKVSCKLVLAPFQFLGKNTDQPARTASASLGPAEVPIFL